MLLIHHWIKSKSKWREVCRWQFLRIFINNLEKKNGVCSPQDFCIANCTLLDKYVVLHRLISLSCLQYKKVVVIFVLVLLFFFRVNLSFEVPTCFVKHGFYISKYNLLCKCPGLINGSFIAPLSSLHSTSMHHGTNKVLRRSASVK